MEKKVTTISRRRNVSRTPAEARLNTLDWDGVTFIELPAETRHGNIEVLVVDKAVSIWVRHFKWWPFWLKAIYHLKQWFWCSWRHRRYHCAPQVPPQLRCTRCHPCSQEMDQLLYHAVVKYGNILAVAEAELSCRMSMNIHWPAVRGSLVTEKLPRWNTGVRKLLRDREDRGREG